MNRQLVKVEEATSRALRRPDPLAEILAGQLSPQTRRAYRTDLAHLLCYLAGARGDRRLPQGQGWRQLPAREKAAALEAALADPAEALARLGEIGHADLVGFRRYLREELGEAAASVNRRLAAARTLLRELQLRGLRADNPAAALKGLRVNHDHSPTIGLTAAEARALLAAPQGPALPALRDRALLALLLRNGLRVGELVGLRVGDLGEDQGFRVATLRGKGGKQRQAKLAGPTWEALAAWLRAADRWRAGPEAPLFCAVRKYGRGAGGSWRCQERPLTVQAVAQIVRKHARAALPPALAARVHPHTLRHTFATLALEAGASLRRVQYAMGHADPRTTERYDRARDNLADNAADYVTRALNGGGGGGEA
jgi:integrase/recombinase XerD